MKVNSFLSIVYSVLVGAAVLNESVPVSSDTVIDSVPPKQPVKDENDISVSFSELEDETGASLQRFCPLVMGNEHDDCEKIKLILALLQVNLQPEEFCEHPAEWIKQLARCCEVSNKTTIPPVNCYRNVFNILRDNVKELIIFPDIQ